MPLFARDYFRRGWHTLSSLFRVTGSNAAATSDTSAFVSWTLSEPGTGQTDYGPTPAYGSTTPLAPALRLDHVQTITGLTAGQTYHARGHSISAAAIHAYTDDMAFTMAGSPVMTKGPRPAPARPTGPAVKVIGTHTVAVDDSGNTDVTAALQAILNSLNGGDILVFAQGDTLGYTHGATPISTYKISNKLYLESLPNNVTLWGYGTRIVQSAIGGATETDRRETFRLNTAGVQNTKFAGFELYGRNYPYSRTASVYSGLGGENDSGVKMLQWHTGTTFEDMWVHHQNGDGIQQVGWNWSMNLYPIENTTVRYCRIEDNSRMGLNPNVGFNWSVHHNVFGNQGGNNINSEDVRLTGAGWTHPRLSMEIYANTFEQSGWEYAPFGPINHIKLMVFTEKGMNYSVLGPFVVRDNLFTGMQPSGVALSGGRAGGFNCKYPAGLGGAYATNGVHFTNVSVTGNTFDLSPWPQPSPGSIAAFRFANVNGLTVTDNDFQGFSVYAPTSGADINTGVTVARNT